MDLDNSMSPTSLHAINVVTALSLSMYLLYTVGTDTKGASLREKVGGHQHR